MRPTDSNVPVPVDSDADKLIIRVCLAPDLLVDDRWRLFTDVPTIDECKACTVLATLHKSTIKLNVMYTPEATHRCEH
jgi:hypothetical protein